MKSAGTDFILNSDEFHSMIRSTLLRASLPPEPSPTVLSSSYRGARGLSDAFRHRHYQNEAKNIKIA